MARYSSEFKERAVARLLPPERAESSRVSQEIGVWVATLERWRVEALPRPARERAWAAAARLEAVITSAAMDEAQRGAWCREKGFSPRTSRSGERARSLRWRSPRKRGRRRRRRARTVDGSRSWRRDLGRNEKALAETTALLVLRKKLQAIFQESRDE